MRLGGIALLLVLVDCRPCCCCGKDKHGSTVVWQHGSLEGGGTRCVVLETSRDSSFRFIIILENHRKDACLPGNSSMTTLNGRIEKEYTDYEWMPCSSRSFGRGWCHYPFQILDCVVACSFGARWFGKRDRRVTTPTIRAGRGVETLAARRRCVGGTPSPTTPRAVDGQITTKILPPSSPWIYERDGEQRTTQVFLLRVAFRRVCCTSFLCVIKKRGEARTDLVV